MPIVRSKPQYWKAFEFFWPHEPSIPDCREDKRHPASGIMTLSWTQPAPGTATVSLRNISAAGMQIELPAPVQAPQRVRLSDGTHEYAGVLLYCEESSSILIGGLVLTESPETLDLGTEPA